MIFSFFRKLKQKRDARDRNVLIYIASHTRPCSVLPLAKELKVGPLYSSLKRLRAKKLIDSVEGNVIAGGAKEPLYFATLDHRRVRLLQPTRFEYHSETTNDAFWLIKGEEGTIVFVYPDGPAFEVEFLEDDGKTKAVVMLRLDQVEILSE